eukprot:scaffold11058_cov118-Skeletonema_dohrnii-CCMP3373.AAC.8
MIVVPSISPSPLQQAKAREVEAENSLRAKVGRMYMWVGGLSAAGRSRQSEQSEKVRQKLHDFSVQYHKLSSSSELSFDRPTADFVPPSPPLCPLRLSVKRVFSFTLLHHLFLRRDAIFRLKSRGHPLPFTKQ